MQGRHLSSKVTNIFKPKFKIKNKTKFPIYFKIANEKIKLESIIDARPGLTGKAVRATRGIIGRKVTTKLQKITDKFTDQVFDLDLENGSNEERREYLNQRDRLVLNMNPIGQGFKLIRPGASYKSSKLHKSSKNNTSWFLTVLTQQFLLETSDPAYTSVSAGCTRLNMIPEGQDVQHMYNVPHINTRLDTLQVVAQLVIEDQTGLMVVRRVLEKQQRHDAVLKVNVEDKKAKGVLERQQRHDAVLKVNVEAKKAKGVLERQQRHDAVLKKAKGVLERQQRHDAVLKVNVEDKKAKGVLERQQRHDAVLKVNVEDKKGNGDTMRPRNSMAEKTAVGSRLTNNETILRKN